MIRRIIILIIGLSWLATILFTKSLSAQPSYVETLFTAAEEYQKGNYKKSSALFEELSQLKPTYQHNFDIAQLLKSEVAIELNHFSKADTLLFQVIQQSKKKTTAYAHAKILQLYSAIYQEQYHEAKALVQVIRKIRRLRKNNGLYAKSLEYQGLLAVELEDYETAIIHYNRALEFLHKTKGKIAIGRLHYRLARINIEMDDYIKADSLLKIATNYLTPLGNGQHPEFAFVKDYKGWLSSLENKHEQAKSNLEQAIRIRKEQLGHKHIKLGESYINLGISLQKAGKDKIAEDYFLKAKTIVDYHNPNSFQAGLALQSLGSIAYKLGSYSKAVNYLEQSATILEKTDKLRFYFSTMNLLVIVYERYEKESEEEGQNTQKIEAAYQRLLTKWVAAKGKDNINYAVIANNLGEFYDFDGQPKKALSLYKEAKAGFEKFKGKLDPNYAAVLNNMGYLYETSGDYEQAEQLYLEMEQIDSTVLGITHPDYIYSLYNIAKFYRIIGNESEMTAYFKKANQYQLDLIHYYYSGFDEAIRISYLKDIQPNFNELYSYLKDNPKPNAELLADAQQISLSIKGLALDYQRSYKEEVQRTNDENLRQYYEQWTTYQQELGKAYSLSASERKSKKIDLTQLKSTTELAEKTFIRQAEKAGIQLNTNRILDVAVLKEKINPQEAVIDFIKYEYYPTDVESSDTTFYQALLTTKGSTTSYFIPICTENELKAVLELSAKYGTGYAKYPEIGQKLYELVWQPLEPYLQEIKTIHISSTGLLHKVAFAGLANADGNLLNQYSIHYYGNLRDFIQTKSLDSPSSIALFGGAIFDLDSLTLVQLAAEEEEFAFVSSESPTTDLFFNSRSIFSDSIRSALEFNYLAGTKTEVESLNSLFLKNDWQTQLFIGIAASEDNFKELAIIESPSIIQIASHGFFYGLKRKRDTLSDATLRDRTMKAENPLLRSGLALRGANYAWKGGHPIPKIENGILTAFEIANLNLSNTQLVVLSACETGLGDMESTEGVFGLQRAFKSAGVDKLLISLWKVPDTQTSELMQLFYKNFLSGQALPQAFKNAQKTMSQKYAPFYWAGFILVE